MTTPHDPTRSFSALDAVIAEYLQAVEAGETPDRAALVALHPELTGALTSFFEDLDRMDRVVSPLWMASQIETSDESLSNAEPTPEIVRYFGDYALIHEVARGGMGVVYRARQVSLNRVVALKMVLAGAFASPRDIQRFRIEAEAAANLDHSHIVPIHEVGEHDGQQYFSMKFIEGTSLAARPWGTPREEVLGLLDVARAVHHAHQRGVLHRDLKPSNILVDGEGRRLVSDFGLAKRLSEVDGSLTETGQLLGTPRYMSPEQALGRKDLTVTADVYSLGVILFERLTGRTPFLADNVVSLLHQVRESEPPRLSSITPNLGRDLETIVAKCLDKTPSRRYPTAEALALDLENWLAGRPIAARPVGPAARAWRWCRRNPAVAALLVTVAISLLAGTAVSIAFAFQAEARAVEAGISATRARLVLAQNVTTRNEEPLKGVTLALLSYARAFRQAPADRSADDLRWYISANLSILGQRFHNLLPPLEGGEIAIQLDALSPDGRTYAALSPDGRLRLWDVLSGRLKATFREDRAGIRTIQFSPDGRLITTIQQRYQDYFQDIDIYGGKTLQILIKMTVEPPRLMRIWDIEMNREMPSMDLEEGPVSDTASFSPDHRHVVLQFSAGDSKISNSDHRNRCVLWDVFQGRRVAEFIGRLSSQFTPDNRYLILEGEKEVSVIDLQTYKERHRFKASSLVISSHSGRELAVVREDQVHFVETQTGREVRTPIGFRTIPWAPNRGGATPSNFDYSPSDRFLGVENDLVELSTGKKVKLPKASTGWIFSAEGSRAFSSDGRRAIDLAELRALPSPIEKRFHPDLVTQWAPNRLFFPDEGPTGSGISELCDLATGLAFAKAGSLPEGGTIFTVDGNMIMGRQREYIVNDSRPEAILDPVYYVPREMFSNDPDVIELWAEVLSRHRLIEGSYAEKLDETEWDLRRQRLLKLLPTSPSPLLTLVTSDRLHWLRREVIEENTDRSINTTSERWDRTDKLERLKEESKYEERERKIAVLSRLIEAEPRWWVRHYRGMALGLQGRTDEAGADIAAVARAAGDWYWKVVPPILDVPTMDRLLLSEDPVSILRDERKLGPDAIEVIARYLGRVSRDSLRTRRVAVEALRFRDRPAEVYRKALEYLLPLKDEYADGPQLLAIGLANYRLGRLQEALAVLLRAEPMFTQTHEFNTSGDNEMWDLLDEDCQVYTALALVQERLGHHQEAVEWLVKARGSTTGIPRITSESPVDPLYLEAEEVILDRNFPADPFAR